MPIDTWLSRVTCRRCGVPGSRVPLMSYPFAYPPNCEATFQAINSNSPRNPPLKIAPPHAPTDNHNQRPLAPDMSTTSVKLAISCFVSSARLAEMAIITQVRPYPSSSMPQVPNAHGLSRHAAHGTPEPPTFHFMEKKPHPPRPVHPNIPKGDPVVVVVAQERNSAS